MKYLKKYILIISVLLFFYSCKDFLSGRDRKTKIYGIVTDDVSGKKLENVKLTVKLENVKDNSYEETGIYTYTDKNGYYELEYKNIDGINTLIPEKDGYVFVLANSHYPYIPTGTETEINIELTKIGPAKMNIITYTGDMNNMSDRLSNVRVSVLKRHKDDNTTYPISIDTIKYTNDIGECYIEFEEEKEYNYFLKPEKEGYFYDRWGNNYYILTSRPGHISRIGLELTEIK